VNGIQSASPITRLVVVNRGAGTAGAHWHIRLGLKLGTAGPQSLASGSAADHDEQDADNKQQATFLNHGFPPHKIKMQYLAPSSGLPESPGYLVI
jgi:hypothetical protein